MNASVKGKPPYNIMIVDDHPMVRDGIATVLSRDSDFKICCGAGSEAEALEASKKVRPDLAIVDLSLTTSSGFSLFRKLQQLYPEIRILVLSMHDESVYAEKALQAGAHGYVMKGETTDTLIKAAHVVLEGQLYVSERMRNALLQGLARGASRSAKGSIGNLTRTELIVLELIGSGVTTREIAQQLKRSTKTVDAHRWNIRRKLGLPNNTALLHYAIQRVRQTV